MDGMVRLMQWTGCRWFGRLGGGTALPLRLISPFGQKFMQSGPTKLQPTPPVRLATPSSVCFRAIQRRKFEFTEAFLLLWSLKVRDRSHGRISRMDKPGSRIVSQDKTLLRQVLDWIRAPDSVNGCIAEIMVFDQIEPAEKEMIEVTWLTSGALDDL